MTETKPSLLDQIHLQEMRMEGIVKKFPGVLANDHVDFDVHSGEIHALLGENGAGKSTLMRQLYGLYRPNEGRIYINDKEVSFHSPQDAIAAGIGMIHQHFMLVPSLTVVENVALGLKSSRGPLLDLDVVEKRLMEISDKYRLKVDPQSYVWQLAVGEQQRVEILKALYRGADLLILDEPTAVLTPQEVDEFFGTLKQMANDGHALIFITHKLHEVIAISNRITVLRDGKVVGTLNNDGVTKTELAQMMVGRPVILQYNKNPQKPGDARLVVENLSVAGDRGSDAVKGVSFELFSGEILGLAGVSGNGQRDLAEALAGLRPVREGKILLNGKDVTHTSPNHHITAGQSYIPEERMKEGAIKDFSVADNIILQDHNRPPYSRGSFLDFKLIDERTTELVNQYNVKTPSNKTPLKNLSGGNIQKLILARELSRKPAVLIASQPTRGVDIGASEYIHQCLLEQRDSGTATMLISEDLDEIRALSDRIAVIYEGRIVGIVDAATTSVEDLGLMMAGILPETLEKQTAAPAD
ncbi:MAG TPA: ABC transporter ATP-binding protein [Anaerolineaceae bacterium]|nr:ABC transporter ATP-binding protein [Anaerolineaceae bacterium]